MIKKTDTYNIEGIKIEVVNVTTRKDILDYLDEYLENLEYEWFDATDELFEIIYKDGSTEYIGSDYKGQKIRRQQAQHDQHNQHQHQCVTFIVFSHCAPPSSSVWGSTARILVVMVTS